jgi:Transglutaminase-like superfamily
LISRLPLAVEAAVILTGASLRVRLRPQSETTALLGNPGPPSSPYVPSAGASIEALRIGRAVERVAAVLPWHPVCLPRAVAVTSMLRRRRIECRAHLGVTGAKPPEAHAWVTVGGVVVQGAPLDGVTELATFA